VLLITEQNEQLFAVFSSFSLDKGLFLRPRTLTTSKQVGFFSAHVFSDSTLRGRKLQEKINVVPKDEEI
jgi:hypothetical protein